MSRFKWVSGMVLAATAAFGQASNVVYSPNIVGFVKVEVPGTNKISMVAVPFEPGNSNGFYTLDEVLGTNFTAYWSATLADEVWVWNAASNKYEVAYLNNGQWQDSAVDWKWCYTDADGFPYPCSQTNLFNITPTTGFFINNRHADRTVYMSGLVPTGSVTTVQMADLQLLANPYPTAVPLVSMIGTHDGAQAYWSSTIGDEIWIWNTAGQCYDQYFLNNGQWQDDAVNWKWCGTDTNGYPFAATNTLLPGMSFFYKSKGAGFQWNVPRPYPLN